MAKLTIQGLDDFSVLLQSLEQKGMAVAKAAVYAGADVMINAVKEEINALPQQQGYMRPGEKRDVVTRREKEALLQHVGIARMDDTGGKVNTAIGFDGYADITTKKYPSGLPVPLIARSIESGSSVRVKHPFLRRAANNAKPAVQRAMLEAAEAEIAKLQK